VELVSSIFYGILFLGVIAFMCIVPFVFITSLFAKNNNVDKAEPWMFIVAGVITLTVFFIGFADKLNWDKVF
jgi:hypothetical protein